jgi:hypothetical protein
VNLYQRSQQFSKSEIGGTVLTVESGGMLAADPLRKVRERTLALRKAWIFEFPSQNFFIVPVATPLLAAGPTTQISGGSRCLHPLPHP